MPKDYSTSSFWSLLTNQLPASSSEHCVSTEVISPAFVPIHWELERARNLPIAELTASLYRNSGARAAAFCVAERCAESSGSQPGISSICSATTNSRENAENSILATKLLLDAGLAVSAWNQIQKATRLLASSDTPTGSGKKTAGDSWVQIVHWQTMALAAAAVHDADTASEWLSRSTLLLRRRVQAVSSAAHSVTKHDEATAAGEDECDGSMVADSMLRQLTGDGFFIQAAIHVILRRTTAAISALRSAVELHLKGSFPENAAADLHFLAQLELSMGDAEAASDSASLGLELLKSHDVTARMPRYASLQNALNTLSERCLRASLSSKARSDVIRGN